MSDNIVRRIIKAIARRPQVRFIIKWALAGSDDYPQILAETMSQNPDAFVRATRDPVAFEALVTALREAEGGDAFAAIAATAIARDPSVADRLLRSASVFDAAMAGLRKNPEALYRFLAQDEFRQTLGVQKAFLADIAADHVLMEKVLTLTPGEMRGWAQSVLEQAPPDESATDPEAAEETGPHQALAALLARPLNPKDTAGKAAKEEAALALVQALAVQKVRLLRAVEAVFDPEHQPGFRAYGSTGLRAGLTDDAPHDEADAPDARE